MEQSSIELPIIDLVDGKISIQTDSEEDALEMIEKLIELLPQDIALLDAAYRARDRKQLLAILHKIKGGLFYCGVPRLRQHIDTIHDWVKDTDDLTSFSDYLDLTKQEYQALKQAHESL